MYGSLRALREIVRAQLLPRSAQEDYLKNALFTYGTATQTEGLEITVDHDEKGNIVHLNGRVSFESSPALRDSLLAMLRGPSPEAVVVDLTKVSYFDSSGIATLIEALKIARNCKTSLCLKGLEGRLLHLFEVTGVSALFESSDCRNAFSGTKVS